MARIQNLEEYGDGWRWTLTFEEGTNFERTVPYHTNREGNGLWMRIQQIEGTGQFSLAGKTREQVRRIIKRRWPD
jgi:hypothetical protein